MIYYFMIKRSDRNGRKKENGKMEKGFDYNF